VKTNCFLTRFPRFPWRDAPSSPELPNLGLNLLSKEQKGIDRSNRISERAKNKLQNTQRGVQLGIRLSGHRLFAPQLIGFYCPASVRPKNSVHLA
jgi:hypothetical protein